MLCFEQTEELSAQEHNQRQISETKLASFPWCSFKEEGPAHSPLWAGRGWGMVLSTLSLVHASVQRGIDVTAHCCPRATLWILCQQSVPWPESPKASGSHLPALHHSPHRLFTCKHPALFKVQLAQAHRQVTWLGSWDPGELVPSSPAAPSKPFHCFVPLSPCKAGGYLLYFHTNHWIYGSKLPHKSWTSFCSITLATLTFGEFQKTKHSPETIPRSSPNTHKECGTTETVTSLHITGMLFVSKGFIY